MFNIESRDDLAVDQDEINRANSKKNKQNLNHLKSLTVEKGKQELPMSITEPSLDKLVLNHQSSIQLHVDDRGLKIDDNSSDDEVNTAMRGLQSISDALDKDGEMLTEPPATSSFKNMASPSNLQLNPNQP